VGAQGPAGSGSAPVADPELPMSAPDARDSYYLEVQGQLVARLALAGGGYPVAQVVTTATPPGKHVANITISDLAFRLYPALPSPELTGWISEFLAGSPSDAGAVRDCAIVVGRADGRVMRRLEFSRAALLELRLDGLDAASPAAFALTFRIRPERFREGLTGGNLPVFATRAAPQVRAFRVSLPGLSTNHILQVGGFTLKRAVLVPPGICLFCVPSYGPLEVSDLNLTISTLDQSDWLAFSKHFLIDGNHLNADELTGSIALVDASLQTELLVLDLRGVGLRAVELLGSSFSSSASRGTTSTFEAHLYVESASLTWN
jgi:hypothetical protein